ncbi:MAG: ribose 5-phosphate isomerase B [Chloroflexota bacterium]
MRIAIGSDHRGFARKQGIMKQVTKAGHTYEDFGSYSEESVDYPDIARKVAGAVAGGAFDRGILICGTGIGMCVVANKIKGIRAALCYDTSCAIQARQHIDANILCLGASEGPRRVRAILHDFLGTGFEGGRHQRRLDKIKAMEE